jgi:tetratricopeptide (TPR) repeat protein
METQPDAVLDWLAGWFDNRHGRAAIVNMGRIQARRHPGRPWMGLASLHAIDADEANPFHRDETSDAWTARVALHPGVNRWHNLGMALLGSDETASIAAYEEALRRDPENGHLRAFLMIAVGREDGAHNARLKQIVDAAEPLAPNDPFLHLNRGRLLHRAGESAAAEASFRKAIALMPQDTELHSELAGLLLENRRYGEALVEYREAVRLYPLGTHYCNLIKTLVHLNDVDAALAEAERALRLFPGNSDVAESSATAFLSASQRASRADDREKALALADRAVALCREALATSPRDGDVRKQLARTLASRASIADEVCHEVVDQYREAIRMEANPGLPAAHQSHEWFAGALLRMGRRDEARAQYATALRLNPRCPEANGSYGEVLARSGADELRSEALGHLRTAVEIGPDLLSARVNLIGALLDGQSGPPQRRVSWSEIEAECRRTIEQAAKSPRAWDPDDDHVVVKLERALGYILDAKFPEAVRRGVKPADRGEARDLVWACSRRRLFAAAAGIAALGLSADCKPRDTAYLDAATREVVLYDGALAAVCAADGQGEDAGALDPAMRAQWRRQALAWLREVCALDADADAGGGAAVRKSVRARQYVARATEDRRLSSVRDPDALAELPLDDRAAWRRFWAEADRAVRSYAEKGE